MIRIYIYKLIKKDATNDDMVYIGSTTDVNKRWRRHKCDYNNKYDLKVYKYIRENGGINEWELIILDEFEIFNQKCKKRDNYENKFIIAFDAINKLNSYLCVSINDIILQKKRVYYDKNSDKIKEKNKEYNKINADKIAEKKKVYVENNREILNEKSKIKYYKNRQIILEKNKIKIKCEICSVLISKGALLEHKKSIKCKSKLNI